MTRATSRPLTQGQILSILAIVNDIAALDEVDEALRKSNEQLAQEFGLAPTLVPRLRAELEALA